jgi:hypothetical protein
MKMNNRGRQMLGTRVTGVEYNFNSRAGRLYMDRRCCCDMANCINFFRQIDPEVAVIRTFAGIKEDTTYRLLADGQWQARTADGRIWEPSIIDPAIGGHSSTAMLHAVTAT